jgi:hypothetical protein
MDRPAADDRMADLEMSELPGSASRMLDALALGSSVGTEDDEEVDDRRTAVARVGSAGRADRAGRRRARPFVWLVLLVLQDWATSPQWNFNCRLSGLTSRVSCQTGRHCCN